MPSALQRPHVLIVSSDDDLADFLGEGLVYAGFWTSTIASAMQVLEVFRLRSFDVMLIDATLGGIGARELLLRLRGLSPRSSGAARSDIPALLIADNPEEVSPELVGDDLVSGLLVAPLEIEQIGQEITSVLAAWRVAHPDRPWADEAALGPSQPC